MTLRAELQAQVRRFDDDAWVALASRGLLRRARKDLEQSAPEVLDGDGVVLVRLGSHEVRFDRGGPAQARCTCPATTICQHILAAALALQAAPAEAAPELDLPAALLAFGAEDCTRHAGKAGHRWAAQFVLDLDLQHDVSFTAGNHLTITFRHPRLTARFGGGGIEGIVLDTPVARPEKYRVAAVLAWQRAHGQAPAPPTRRAAKGPPPAEGLARDAARQRLRAAVAALACECVELGLTHLSETVQQRWTTLAVWAQGADYPRLARLLRRLADHVELLLDRAGAADEHRLFDELTVGLALVTALDRAAPDCTPAALIGVARRRYLEAGRLDLFGVGALAFRSGSGFAGLTMLFWNAADRTFLTCTDARPTTLRSFDPIARYRAPGPWSGLGAPQEATGRRVLLTDAQIDEHGRLSAAERTVAVVQPPAPLADDLPTVSSWRQLPPATVSLLAEAQPLHTWIVLRPSTFLSPCFDAARQTLVWPLVDDEGSRLPAELRWSTETDGAIERIESLDAATLRSGTLLVARLQHRGAGAVAEPLSLLHPRPDGVLEVDALHFDPPPGGACAASPLSGRADVEARALGLDPTPTCLRALRHWLQARAERGAAPENLAALRGELDVLTQRALAAGCAALRSSPDPERRAGELLLRTNYVCLLYLRALDAEVETGGD